MNNTDAQNKAIHAGAKTKALKGEKQSAIGKSIARNVEKGMKKWNVSREERAIMQAENGK